MLELARTVRFCINPAIPLKEAFGDAAMNSFAAWPSPNGLSTFYEISVTIRGEPDPNTGYVVSINDIDAAVRREAVAILHRALRDDPRGEPAMLLPEIFRALENRLARPVHALRWRLTPYHGLALMRSEMSHIRFSQVFEFAAAHRLHARELTEAENEAAYGKCNRAHGHGHNYRIEVTASAALPDTGGPLRFTMSDLERIVHECVLEVFDHRNLNVDLPEFAECSPSLERITDACFDRLQQPITEAAGRLERVQVWETEKTSCTRERNA